MKKSVGCGIARKDAEERATLSIESKVGSSNEGEKRKAKRVHAKYKNLAALLGESPLKKRYERKAREEDAADAAAEEEDEVHTIVTNSDLSGPAGGLISRIRVSGQFL